MCRATLPETSVKEGESEDRATYAGNKLALPRRPLKLALLWRVAFDPPWQPFAYALRQPTLPETSVKEGESEDRAHLRGE